MRGFKSPEGIHNYGIGHQIGLQYRVKDISLIIFDMEILKNFEIFLLECPFFVMLNLILDIGGHIRNSRPGIAENPIPLLP